MYQKNNKYNIIFHDKEHCLYCLLPSKILLLELLEYLRTKKLKLLSFQQLVFINF